jgi:hypothetical protein
LSLDAVQLIEIRVGKTAPTDTTGAGLGGVVSRGVEKVTVLLLADRWPCESIAYTEKVQVPPAMLVLQVNVVLGGSTRKQPLPPLDTQYHQVEDDPFDASQASETLRSVEAVIRRLVGAVGAP